MTWKGLQAYQGKWKVASIMKRSEDSKRFIIQYTLPGLKLEVLTDSTEEQAKARVLEQVRLWMEGWKEVKK